MINIIDILWYLHSVVWYENICEFNTDKISATENSTQVVACIPNGRKCLILVRSKRRLKDVIVFPSSKIMIRNPAKDLLTKREAPVTHFGALNSSGGDAPGVLI